MSLPFNRLVLLIVFFAMDSYGLIPIRLITHNIRFATTTPGTNEKPWTERRQLVLNQLHYHTLYNPESFICLQEVLNHQLSDIMNGLNTASDEWAYIGVGRNDGKQSGEYSPILFRPQVWKLETWKTLWLSETPTKPGSKGWDAANTRIVTVGTFTHRQSSKKVVGMCTHFDDQGSVARTESAKLIIRIMNETIAASNGSAPVFLAGDLNSEPTGGAYQILNGQESIVHDVRDLNPSWRYGDSNTFTGFTDSKTKSLIDFVFVGPNDGHPWDVEGYSVLPNRFEDGVHNSDHRAVIGDVVLKT